MIKEKNKKGKYYVRKVDLQTLSIEKGEKKDRITKTLTIHLRRCFCPSFSSNRLSSNGGNRNLKCLHQDQRPRIKGLPEKSHRSPPPNPPPVELAALLAVTTHF
ncbi:hypothetical protein L2E82_35457 [Cichorium intybus]|uniref:Uncharacterized protein n=1 Tax=Cichorium intybus TaxID=13427 RepID=A0ACB9BNW5_CICIN|nr:hypothetical protein L2E82_35457 [Cichorium intybus]